jgi:hypothetical protein
MNALPEPASAPATAASRQPPTGRGDLAMSLLGERFRVGPPDRVQADFQQMSRCPAQCSSASVRR